MQGSSNTTKLLSVIANDSECSTVKPKYTELNQQYVLLWQPGHVIQYSLLNRGMIEVSYKISQPLKVQSNSRWPFEGRLSTVYWSFCAQDLKTCSTAKERHNDTFEGDLCWLYTICYRGFKLRFRKYIFFKSVVHRRYFTDVHHCIWSSVKKKA